MLKSGLGEREISRRDVLLRTSGRNRLVVCAWKWIPPSPWYLSHSHHNSGQRDCSIHNNNIDLCSVDCVPAA